MSHLAAHIRGQIGALELDVEFDLTAMWTTLFGPSGSGKSTILRALCGLTDLPSQQVTLANRDISTTPPHQRSIGLVAQQPALFPHMTVRQNIRFAMLAPSSRDEADLLERFSLTALADKLPRSISGGEAQRVAIVRAIAARPKLLLLDEAFTGLHTGLRHALIDHLHRWQVETSTPILAVTHDVAEAMITADEVFRLQDGRITAQGPAPSVLLAERVALLDQLAASLAPANPGFPKQEPGTK